MLAALLVAVVAAVGTAAWVWRSTEAALERERIDRLVDRGTEADTDPGAGTTEDDPGLDGVLNVLVVGSDSREGLTAEERAELSTGNFSGERTDTILLAQVRPDGVAIVSFPRDLRVEIPGHGPGKINESLEIGGRNALVGSVEDLVGIEIDHYVEVSIPSFLEIVEAAGGVELCLDEPLRDRDAGADFRAGCHDMDGPEALSYVRSRSGERGDFDRVERQQRFLVALAERATALDVLANPVRLHDLATTVADGLTVDDGLTIGRLVELGQAMRDVLEEGLDSVTLPAYARTIEGVDYMVPYEPGVEELDQRLSQREPLPPRPDEDVRETTSLLLFDAGDPQAAAQVESVLFFAGWSPQIGRTTPQGLEAGDDVPSRVYPVDGDTELAEAVAGVLGAEVGQLPAGQESDIDADVVVVVGEGRGGSAAP